MRHVRFNTVPLRKKGRIGTEAKVDNRETTEKFRELLEVMARLRSETGCPWDKEQTHVSLKPCLLEETYELLDALDNGEPKKIQEELGDVLLQVIFHAQIASEENRFSIKEVIQQLTEKLVRRHPYVFAGEPLPEDAAAVLKQRMQIKADEKGKSGESSLLGNVPKSMPALARAQSISRRAAHLGFEWPEIDRVWDKVEEEIRELKEAAASGDKVRTGEELGDLLFTMVNIARFLDVESEDVLAQTCGRFTRRFRHIEAQLKQVNKRFEQSSLEELDLFWEEAKKIEAEQKRRS
ncbi:MAG TPA: nucleoside triphosphate pyrophosphohydrolase [Candidatus Binatia bacterium]|jgi:tetrapyrrole methylase family protein/MazG family protein